MKIVSLFSGAGGLDLGMIRAGNEVIWANDYDVSAVATYRKNIGKHIVCENIAKIKMSDIPDGADVVIGGFPCQGFSQANLLRTVDDERNTLYRFFRRVIVAKKPKYFVAENVKGILHFAQGRVFQRILEDMRELGYVVKYKLFNVADYGVPQRRERVIFVGVRNGIDFEYEFPAPTHSKDGTNGLPRWVSVGEALTIYPDPDVSNNIPNHAYSRYKLNFNGYLGHRPLDPDKPAPTVTARGDDKGGVVILPHPNGERRMTGRELATVQGFPPTYRFMGPLSSVYRQIGNAVPPLFARQIARQFLVGQGGWS